MAKTCMYFEKCNAPFHGYCWATPGYIDECPVDCDKKEIDEDIPLFLTIVDCEYDPVFICENRADAEELILAIAEENIYEHWLWPGLLISLYEAAGDYWIREGVPFY